MKHYNIVVAFLPWILFGTLSGHTLLTVNIGTLVALVLTIIFNHHEVRKGYSLAWVSLIFFLFLFITVFLMENNWITIHIPLLIDCVLVLLSWLSLIVGRPFTEDYAKENIPSTLWNTSNFKQRNKLMTGAWAILFLIDLLVTIYYPNENYFFNLLRTTFAILIGLFISLFILDQRVETTKK